MVVRGDPLHAQPSSRTRPSSRSSTTTSGCSRPRCADDAARVLSWPITSAPSSVRTRAIPMTQDRLQVSQQHPRCLIVSTRRHLSDRRARGRDAGNRSGNSRCPFGHPRFARDPSPCRPARGRCRPGHVAVPLASSPVRACAPRRDAPRPHRSKMNRPPGWSTSASERRAAPPRRRPPAGRRCRARCRRSGANSSNVRRGPSLMPRFTRLGAHLGPAREVGAGLDRRA